MLKQFRQKHWENHKHRYYKLACTDCTIMGILHSEEIKPSEGKNALYLSVNIFSIESYRRMFVYTFCLTYKCLSLSHDANKIKTLNTERA